MLQFTFRPADRDDDEWILDRIAIDLSSSMELEGHVRPMEVFMNRAAALRSSISSSSNPEAIILAEDEEGRRAGFVWVAMMKDENIGVDRAFIFDVHVEKSFRGRGLGSALMDKAEEWGRSIGSGSIGLAVSEGNSVAFHLYESKGYATKRRVMTKPL